MLHSKQWHYSLHRDFQNCYSTRRSPTGFFKLQFQLQFYTCTLHYNPENSPSRIQFYMQKTKSSSRTTTTTYRGQRDLQSRFQKRNSTHRRQGDLLRNPSVCSTGHSRHSAARPSKGIQTFQTFQSFQSFQTFQTLQRHSRHSSHS